MIAISDATLLAFTKLKTRKVRTFFTIVVAGLLFSGVFAVLLISQGFFQSADAFSKQAMVGRYIVSAQDASIFTTSSGFDEATNPELIEKAKVAYEKLISDKKRESKRLGIAYDPSTDRSPIIDSPYESGKKMLDSGSMIAQQVLSEYSANNKAKATINMLTAAAKPYGAKAFYETHSLAPKYGAIVEMKQGKEVFDVATKPIPAESSPMGNIPSDTDEMTLAAKSLVQLHLMKDQVWQPTSGHIPVVVTEKRAATLLKYPAPKADAPALERLNYAKELRKRAAGLTFVMCYRNSVSQSQITQAVSTAKEIAANKTNKNYTKPSLVYGVPGDTSCAQAAVVSDTRSADEKSYTAKENEFRRLFNEQVDPVQQKITFEVVGIAPNSFMDTMTDGTFSIGVGEMLSSMLASQTFRFSIPEEMYNQLPNKEQYADILSQQQQFGLQINAQMYAEFADAESARQFMKKESCTFGMSGKCEPVEKKFMLSSFGSNSIAIEEAKKVVDNVIVVFTLIVMAIAGLIAGLTIGRTIADGRRETAVFRAIGFKRLDISQVYVTYTLLLCVGIILVSFGIGYGVALIIDNLNWVNATVAAQMSLGITDSQTQFHFIGMSVKLLWVVAAIAAAGLLGMALPLLRNVRRSPIRDMRDE
ncbi:MAG TPA: ABC transporter permease [Candidatus Saccharimonas sp.]|jgi:hypothetical protein|nr:ABC transporter permease [Candidatus Saccharimonas sp.]